ncbi:hypothetical protein BOX15_Mlig030987g1, partial [Macrostomum lignano]
NLRCLFNTTASLRQCKLSPTLSSLLTSSLSTSSTTGSMHDKIAEMVKANKVVVFMKGVPEEPRCGFSNAVIKILEFHGLKPDVYSAHNVLDNEQLRQDIKTFSDWPTIPQVYFNGEFIGGCDVLIKMHQNGELIEELKKIGIKSALLAAQEEKKE